MKLDKTLNATIAATAIVGAIGFAYAPASDATMAPTAESNEAPQSICSQRANMPSPSDAALVQMPTPRLKSDLRGPST